MKIVVADDMPASVLELFCAEGWELDARTGRAPDQLAADLQDADALIVRSATRVTAELIDAAPKLRVIARAGTGVDNVDVPAASARGIVVMNAPGANKVSVAELAIGLMLAMARHIPAADAAMKQRKWEKKNFLGEEVRGKTLGLVGLGRIGQEVARRAAAFGMRIVAHDPFISELRPFIELGERLGTFLAQMNDARIHRLGVRYYGELSAGRNDVIVNAVLVGLFRPILSTGVTLVNARTMAAERGIEIVESRSSRPRDYTSLLSVKLYTSQKERWAEGAVFERTSPRLVLVDGIEVEAPLDGTMIVVCNDDQPGVIGEVGTILGRHGVNIANFALGRNSDRAVGVVNIDETAPIPDAVLADILKVKAIREARVVRVGQSAER